MLYGEYIHKKLNPYNAGYLLRSGTCYRNFAHLWHASVCLAMVSHNQLVVRYDEEDISFTSDYVTQC